MKVPDRIAMCVHPQGGHPHVPLKSDEALPTSCFQDCDCTPVEFVRVTWIDGEAYSPLTSRERAFSETTVQMQAEVERLRRLIGEAYERRGGRPMQVLRELFGATRADRTEGDL